MFSRYRIAGFTVFTGLFSEIFKNICVTKWFHIYLKPIGYKYRSRMRRDVFQAIADPTRRAIINVIANQSMNLNAVADKFDVSRPAISKHIKILSQCGLVTIKQVGRERYCEARLQKLNEVSEWIEQYRVFWNNKLDALENFLAQDARATDNDQITKKPNKK